MANKKSAKDTNTTKKPRRFKKQEKTAPPLSDEDIRIIRNIETYFAGSPGLVEIANSGTRTFYNLKLRQNHPQTKKPHYLQSKCTIVYDRKTKKITAISIVDSLSGGTIKNFTPEQLEQKTEGEKFLEKMKRLVKQELTKNKGTK